MDGGMGRLLKEMGAPFQQPEWSALSLMEAPEFVTQAHDQFIDAGAEIIITNSYALVPYHIGQERFDKEGRTLIKLSGEIAKKCADKAEHNVLVAGSIPPAFGSYRPDLFIEEKATDIYRSFIEEQEPFVDVWLSETVSTTKEAIKIKEALGNSKKPYWISYTLQDQQDENASPKLRSGETVELAIKAALELNAEAILFNCSQPEQMEPALDVIQSMNVDIKYGVYANSFEEVKSANGEISVVRQDNTPENYLTFAQKWVEKGASIIGGCCGIMPEHIQKLSEINK